MFLALHASVVFNATQEVGISRFLPANEVALFVKWEQERNGDKVVLTDAERSQLASLGTTGLYAALFSPRCPFDFVERCTERPEWEFTAMARHPDLPRARMDALVRSGRLQDREAVASNPSLEPAQFDLLVRDSVPSVRRSLAQNPALPTETTELLLRDSVPVRLALAWNSHVVASHGVVLAADAEVEVRERLASTQHRPDLLELLAGDAAPEVRGRVAAHSQLSPLLVERLARPRESRPLHDWHECRAHTTAAASAASHAGPGAVPWARLQSRGNADRAARARLARR